MLYALALPKFRDGSVQKIEQNRSVLVIGYGFEAAGETGRLVRTLESGRCRAGAGAPLCRVGRNAREPGYTWVSALRSATQLD